MKGGRYSAAIEDYLRAIYGLVERREPVTTTTLAARLGLSPSSASGMVSKLADEGLVTHVRYHSIELSPAGTAVARSVLRRHRLIEAYLVSELGYTWDEVHTEADALEHAVSDLLINRISAQLGEPTHDPHGDPIPAADGSIEESTAQLLERLSPGAVGEIVRVWDTNPDLLRYLADRGIGIGDRIEVVSREPFGGPLVVKVGEPPKDTVHSIGDEVAAALSVRLNE